MSEKSLCRSLCGTGHCAHKFHLIIKHSSALTAPQRDHKPGSAATDLMYHLKAIQESETVHLKKYIYHPTN